MRHLFASHLAAVCAAVVAVLLRLDWNALVSDGQGQAIVIGLLAIAALLHWMMIEIKAGVKEIIAAALAPQPVVSRPDRVAEGVDGLS